MQDFDLWVCVFLYISITFKSSPEYLFDCVRFQLMVPLSTDSYLFFFSVCVFSEILKKSSSIHPALLRREVEAVRDKQRTPLHCDELLQHISSLPTETTDCPEWHEARTKQIQTEVLCLYSDNIHFFCEWELFTQKWNSVNIYLLALNSGEFLLSMSFSAESLLYRLFKNVLLHPFHFITLVLMFGFNEDKFIIVSLWLYLNILVFTYFNPHKIF